MGGTYQAATLEGLEEDDLLAGVLILSLGEDLGWVGGWVGGEMGLWVGGWVNYLCSTRC